MERTPVEAAADELLLADANRRNKRDALIQQVRHHHKLGVTQVALARQAGVNLMTIRAWLKED
jgi:DNA-binding XRE family transcriptional regulator